MNFLYPVVHDLTDLEYANNCGGCNATEAFAIPGCFSLQDLVNPEHTPIPMEATETTPRRARRADQSLYYTKSLVDDRNDSSSVDERKIMFNDSYVLTRQLNKGQVSNVWECVHRTTGVRYAVKIMDRRHVTPKDIQSALAEVSILTQIQSPEEENHVSQMIDFFEEEHMFYIVLEYATGGDFLRTIVKNIKLSENDAKLFAKSLLKGLRYLHENHIVHRNLKPENILLKKQGDVSSVVLSDLGMSARILVDSDGDALMLTERFGTAQYMAPEVIQQKLYGTQIDMWSVGVILYYVLVGHLPFEDVSRRALYQKILKTDYSFHPKDWLGISRSAKRFISSLLHAESDVRMTAEEALEHPWLQADTTNVAPVVSPLSSPRSSGRPVKKLNLKQFWRRNKKQPQAADSDVAMEEVKSNSSQTVSCISSAQ